MDQITKSLLDDFTSQFELELGEAEAFEYFCNFTLMSRGIRYTLSLEALEDIHTGGGSDGGFDGIAIMVNGKLVTTTDEIDDLVNSTNYLEAELIFIQAKTGRDFDNSKINTFFFNVGMFISEEEAPHITYSEQVFDKRALWKHIIQNKSANMVRGLPTCKMFFATTGNWQGDNHLETVIEIGKSNLDKTRLFSEINFSPVGATELQKYYRDTKNKLEVTITFANKVTLPEIGGITESYFGILPFVEFTRLIHDEYNGLFPVFYDNVRDFQGEENPVNEGIKQTLTDKKFDLFCVLNNGVTVVAKSLTPAGNKFTLRDYQIVNGCQTSHVLSAHAHLEGVENVNVPIRVIVTTDDEIRNQITKATNSQTEIKPEQLAAQTDFQKSLEQYYNSITDVGQLFYERRSGQYLNTQAIKSKIITLQIQIKTFTAMFLDSPHSVSGYYGTIADNFQSKLFGKEHKFSPYYTSALAYYRLENLFRGNIINSKYKKVRYHLLVIARLLGNPENLPHFNSHKMEAYCAKIIKALNDSTQCTTLFEKTTEIFDGSGLDLAQTQFKSEAETKQLLKHAYTVIPNLEASENFLKAARPNLQGDLFSE